MFLLTNIKDETLSQFGDYYYQGTSVQPSGEQLVVAKSVRSHNSFDAELANFDFGQSLLDQYDATYILMKLNKSNGVLTVQTDLLSFEPAFYYSHAGKFVVASRALDIVEFLVRHNVQLTLSEKKIRELMYFGVNFPGETPVNEVRRFEAASVYEISAGGVSKKHELTGLVSEEKVPDAKTAANQLFQLIDTRFTKNIKSEKKYGIGLSGGLDSRVAAFFAKKHNAQLVPFFVGDRRGNFGVLSYDAKRSLEVKQELGLSEVRFLNPLEKTWTEKVNNDLMNATLSSSNAHINIGYDFEKFDVLLNGAMGGELFGASIKPQTETLSDEGLTDYLLSYVGLLPTEKYPRNIVAKVLFKKGFLHSTLTIPKSVYNELISEDHMKEIKQKMLSWVRSLKAKGFTNTKIIQSDLYLRYSNNHFFGFFYGFNGTKPVLPVYLTPSVIRYMMTWATPLFLGKQVQGELIKNLGGLAKIRSQTTETSIQARQAGVGNSLLVGLERVFRGGGMNYRNWIRSGGLEKMEKQYSLQSEMPLKSEYWVNAPLLRLTSIKIAMLRDKYRLAIK